MKTSLQILRLLVAWTLTMGWAGSSAASILYAANFAGQTIASDLYTLDTTTGALTLVGMYTAIPFAP